MKKKLLFLSLLASLSTGLRADDFQYLVFTLSDGTTKSISATGLTMTFADGILTVTDGTKTLSLTAAQLTKMEFSNDDAAGIASLTVDELNSADAQVYDLNGRRLQQPLSALGKGVYVIKSNGHSTKIQVK